MITISAFADEIDPCLATQMDACQANGIKCIDVRGIDGINVSDMTLAQVAGYKKQLDDRGFTVPCIGSPLGKIKMDENFDKHLDLLKHSCDVAKAFGTDMIRIFSFYPSEGTNIDDQRDAVMERLSAMVEVAQTANCILMHENESHIYGRKTRGVLDIFSTIKSKHLQSIFDPANFVAEEVRPYDDCWNKGLRELTTFFHIKDKKIGVPTCVPAGQGDGQFDPIFADVKKFNFSGYMTLEPHMKRAEQYKGFTGPELFTKAVQGLKDMLTKHGIPYAR
jgi:sugar phosphate isomerase/epimerase